MDNISAYAGCYFTTKLEVRIMKKSKSRYVIIFILLSVSGCTDLLVGPTPSTTPTAIFDELWHDFDARYSLFDIHGVNWDSLYQIYRPHITNQTQDSVLARTIDTLLRNLHDPHVGISAYANNKNFGSNFGEPYLDSAIGFDFTKVSSYYLRNTAQLTGYGEIIYGFVDDSIGYIYLPTFNENSSTYGWAAQLGSVLDTMQSVKGLIIDIRGNSGGTQGNFNSIASHFFTKKQTVLYNSLRNGPNHEDFSIAEAIAISPSGKIFTKPIILITDRFTISAGEWFTLAMKSLPNVTRVGDTTSGAFSGRLDRELANGWTYSMSIEKVTDANGISFEGKGIPPDITIHLPPHYRAAFSKDTTLDKAIEILSK
jgi:carboxyl-terminal processing protease